MWQLRCQSIAALQKHHTNTRMLLMSTQTRSKLNLSRDGISLAGQRNRTGVNLPPGRKRWRTRHNWRWRMPRLIKSWNLWGRKSSRRRTIYFKNKSAFLYLGRICVRFVTRTIRVCLFSCKTLTWRSLSVAPRWEFSGRPRTRLSWSARCKNWTRITMPRCSICRRRSFRHWLNFLCEKFNLACWMKH